MWNEMLAIRHLRTAVNLGKIGASSNSFCLALARKRSHAPVR